MNKCMETAVINYRCGNVVRGNAATVTTGEASESGGRGEGRDLLIYRPQLQFASHDERLEAN